jgi:small subunit ribosomal protein S5
MSNPEEKKEEVVENKKEDVAKKTVSKSEEVKAKQEEKTTSQAQNVEKKTEAIKDPKAKEAAKSNRPGSQNRNFKRNDRKNNNQADDGFMEKVIAINRITKVTKGGKKLSFRALVVVGDTKGKVGYSLSKASEVATAIKKALVTAKKNMVDIPKKGTSIPHEIIGKCSGSRVLLKPASEGTGVIASGPVRAVCDGAGIHDILTKCHRSNNPINVVKATIDGLLRLKRVKPEDQPNQVKKEEV